MVLGWIVLFGEMHEIITNQGEDFKGTLTKSCLQEAVK